MAKPTVMLYFVMVHHHQWIKGTNFEMHFTDPECSVKLHIQVALMILYSTRSVSFCGVIQMYILLLNHLTDYGSLCKTASHILFDYFSCVAAPFNKKFSSSTGVVLEAVQKHECQSLPYFLVMPKYSVFWGSRLIIGKILGYKISNNGLVL